MPATAHYATADELLLGLGADRVEHPGGTLLAHLRRVRDLLADWDAGEEVQLAGLCHALYGTDGFSMSLLDWRDRAELAGVVGIAAERHVYLYASCNRAQVYPQLNQQVVEFTDRFTGARLQPSAVEIAAFAEITAANEYDLMRHSRSFAADHGTPLRQLMQLAQRHLSAAAAHAWAALPMPGDSAEKVDLGASVRNGVG